MKIAYSLLLLFVKWTIYHFLLVAGVQKQHIIALTTTLNKFLFSVVRYYSTSSDNFKENANRIFQATDFILQPNL